MDQITIVDLALLVVCVLLTIENYRLQHPRSDEKPVMVIHFENASFVVRYWKRGLQTAMSEGYTVSQALWNFVDDFPHLVNFEIEYDYSARSKVIHDIMHSIK